ncbi:hypothetical protein DAPPUDRAFT_253057 [Daphnia pulex]|uniref:Hexosyltransferase n=1 Tax=Daphnia pulex TaxID=6669 RepID=E9H431_DAPPU|nr:hypothetical protein DAPPUDRAFT_253057 [Daphnia pulex]|eukprot:EFX73507.1 hypothetical protein DAPPUDRAFT_253057 [Daphnia pulex]
MSWNLVKTGKQLITQLVIITTGLIILAIIYQQELSLQSSKETAMEVKFSRLEKKLNDCEAENKTVASSLETESNLVRKNNETLANKIKLLEQEKNQTEQLIDRNRDKLQSNVTVIERDFFHYMAVSLRDTPYPGVENYTRYTVARLGMLPFAGIELLKPEYGPVINNVTSFRYPITVPACQIPARNNQSVFVAVISAPSNFDKRNTIRQTWRTHLNFSYHNSIMVVAGFAFILGLTDNDNTTQIKIEEESKTHGDLIQIEMSDFYRNLSLKVAGLFNWLYRHCQQIDFLFKVDDDVYVNALISPSSSGSTTGPIRAFTAIQLATCFLPEDKTETTKMLCNCPKPPEVVQGGKWNVSVEEWPWKDYPRYFFGPGVLFPGGTIFPFLASFQTTPLHPVDDLYYSGICSEKAGVKVRWSTSSNSVMAMGQPAVPDACVPLT